MGSLKFRQLDIDGANGELVTTDYVIDELLTLMKMRGEFQRALHVGASLFAEEIAHVAWVLPGDMQQAWRIFQRYHDKAWSRVIQFSYRGCMTDSKKR